MERIKMAKRITIIALVIGTAGLFIDPINDLVTSEISTNLLIPTFLIYFTFIFVTKSIEKYKHANNKELKIEDYYQEVSKEDLIGLIKDWTDLLNDTSLKMYLMKEEAKKDIPKPLLKKMMKIKQVWLCRMAMNTRKLMQQLLQWEN